MKEKIGIALLILLNAGFIYLLVIVICFSYWLIVGNPGLKAVETADSAAESIFNKAAFLSFTALLVNYILFKFLLQSRKSIISSIVVTLIGLLICIPFYFTERWSFIDRKYSQVMLIDYLDSREVSKVQLLIREDTIPIDYCENFFHVIGTASYSQGMWKYQKSMKILIWKKDGIKDSILSNGDLFEFKGKFFKAEENLVEKYLKMAPTELN